MPVGDLAKKVYEESFTVFVMMTVQCLPKRCPDEVVSPSQFTLEPLKICTFILNSKQEIINFLDSHGIVVDRALSYPTW